MIKSTHKKKKILIQTLLVLGVSACLLLSASEIYSFYKMHQPPFEVGECFSINDSLAGEIKFQVIKNNRYDTTMVAIGTFYLGLKKFQILIKATFDNIRESTARKVDC